MDKSKLRRDRYTFGYSRKAILSIASERQDVARLLVRHESMGQVAGSDMGESCDWSEGGTCQRRG